MRNIITNFQSGHFGVCFENLFFIKILDLKLTLTLVFSIAIEFYDRGLLSPLS
jgi:hypothetical protein